VAAAPPISDTAQPLDIEKEGHSPTTGRQWVKKIQKQRGWFERSSLIGWVVRALVTDWLGG